MNICPNCSLNNDSTETKCVDCGGFLKGMQGPERHLVGDVAERIPRQGGVEEAKPGRRGVGEIVGATELRGHIAREIAEAHRLARSFARQYDNTMRDFNLGEKNALEKLLQWLDDRAGERSDLSNAKVSDRPS